MAEPENFVAYLEQSSMNYCGGSCGKMRLSHRMLQDSGSHPDIALNSRHGIHRNYSNIDISPKEPLSGTQNVYPYQ